MEDIEIVVSAGLITSKTVAWGGKAPELHKASLEAIRFAVSSSPHKAQLQQWLETRTKLRLSVEFGMKKQRVALTDLDSLLSDLMNPLVEGACGPRESGKPVPQTKDALFWQVNASKVEAEDEQIVLRINSL